MSDTDETSSTAATPAEAPDGDTPAEQSEYVAKQAEAAGGDEPYDPRGELPPYGEDGQDYVDRSVVDFDPKDGLYSGTAVDGSTRIPGEHPDLDERGIDYDVEPVEAADGQAEEPD